MPPSQVSLVVRSAVLKVLPQQSNEVEITKLHARADVREKKVGAVNLMQDVTVFMDLPPSQSLPSSWSE